MFTMDKQEIIYGCKYYKVIRKIFTDRKNKEIWICKGCNKEFKQHAKFHDHNSKDCLKGGR
ncbi:unnamed protein product [marine sediment metagenome]|uniref:Uncharacterized protein n=1 Tax=marine sediment metagenome TaxID=412755 RepID=X0W311_9ZZZZ